MFVIDKKTVVMPQKLTGEISWGNSSEILNLFEGNVLFSTTQRSEVFEECSLMSFFLDYAAACYQQVLNQGELQSSFLAPDALSIWKIRLKGDKFLIVMERSEVILTVDCSSVWEGLRDSLVFLYNLYASEFPENLEILSITHTIGVFEGKNSLNPHFL